MAIPLITFSHFRITSSIRAYFLLTIRDGRAKTYDGFYLFMTSVAHLVFEQL